MNSHPSSIGFIGLGAMGQPMCRRVAGAGFSLVVLDADRKRTESIAADLGAQSAATGADLARQADTIITMLPTSNIVAQVLGGPDGVLAALRPGALVIDMSSGVPSKTREISELVTAKGGRFIDAPVSGGVAKARTGELAIMVGGDADALAMAEPVLRVMGSTIVPTGPIGSAHAMKALNNLVSAGGFLIGVEALLIGQRFGLDPALMVDVLNASTGMNNSTQKKFKQFVLSRRFDAGFGLDLMIKDLGIALGIAHEGGTPAPFSALCREIWAAAGVTLGPGQDHTALARYCEKNSGSELI